MSLAAQRRQPTRDLARAALAELDAPEPDRSPATLMGGELAWDDSWVTRVEAQRDPDNAPTMRPHVIAPCQALHAFPALRLRCLCGAKLDFVALAAFSTGVLAVSSSRRLLPKLRSGGVSDLAAVDSDDLTRPWSLLPWEASMRERAAAHRTAWAGEPHPVLPPGGGVIGDTAKRQTFVCSGSQCSAVHTFRNVALVRLVLRAIAAGEDEVQLGRPGVAAAPTQR